MVKFLDRFGSSSLGIAYDVANGEFVGEDQVDAIRTAAPWLLQVHLSDASRTRWDHAPIGRASIDFAAIGQALQDEGFQGTSVVEPISDEAGDDMVSARIRLAAYGWH